MFSSWQVSWTWGRGWYDGGYFFLFFSWPHHRPLWDQMVRLWPLLEWMKAVGVSLLGGAGDVGLPWGHRRPKMVSWKLLPHVHPRATMSVHPSRPFLLPAPCATCQLSFRLSCLTISWKNISNSWGFLHSDRRTMYIVNIMGKQVRGWQTPLDYRCNFSVNAELF